MKLGQEARIRIDAYPNQTFKGVVTEVGRQPDPPRRRARPATPSSSWSRCRSRTRRADVKPGLSVQADILTGFRPKALVVPIQALVIRDREMKPGDAATGTPRDEEGVFLMEDGKAKFQPIKTGPARRAVAGGDVTG